ncbi:AI-2E family transporter [Pontibacter lucknowensis]|uniref:Predicted PurR-regulated permease PerM n=1 Tax=Pontibacter lucknowensis TaxID=1077936 RepID=A0A1N6WD75_9BACT|nr:AI-2E family transporter [Pontibacter lucknowensis]SIQ88071.1 Predicted PurR-regulated permease PerM [Pontibacter lucknowensis]
MKQEISFTRKVVITTSVVLLLSGALALVLYAVHFFFLVFASILFAVLLRAMTNWLHDKTGVGKGLALALSSLLFFGLIFLAGWLIAPTVQAQIEDLRETLPSSIERLKDQLGRTSWGAKALDELESSQESMMPETQEIVNKAQTFFTSTISIITDLFIVIVIGIFFASSPAQYQKGIVSLVPVRHRTRLWEVLDKSYETLKWWLFGKLVTMVFVGILTAVGLMLLGIPMALALAVIAFFLDFIPTVGPILASVPAILIAFLDGPMAALYVAILYFIIQSIESYLLAPLIFEKTVHISPVITLLSLVLFGILVGPLGVILAAPLVAVLQVFVRELYIKDYLERDLPKNQ